MPAQNSAQKNKPTKINLVPAGEFESSTLGRILKWLLSSFRVIVIIVELIVLVVFISRFWLDARNSDLNDTIKQKEAQIRASSSFESEFRLVQNKLDTYQKLIQNQEEARLLTFISSSLPEQVRLRSVVFETQSINISGSTLSEQLIASYLANLRASEDFASVDLVSIEKSAVDELFLNFTISATTTKRGA